MEITESKTNWWNTDVGLKALISICHVLLSISIVIKKHTDRTDSLDIILAHRILTMTMDH